MKMKKKFWILLKILAGAILLLTGGAWLYDRYASRQALIDFPPPGQFVTVNGARMHYLCQGAGEPTLVLEAGFDGGALDWTPILPALAEHHRVCAFDRLGQDYSDPAPHPRTFSTAADELHSALEILGIKKPVVIGHSLGGALVQVYASKYEVSGVILVEGLTSDVVEPVTQRLGSYQALDALGRLGLLRPLGMIGADFAYPEDIRQKMIALRSRSSALLNLTDEGAVAAGSAPAELRAAEVDLHRPLLVISAEQTDVPGLPAGAFVDAQKALADRVVNSQYVFIPEAKHHYIMADHSQFVIEAIEDWLVNLK
jgi:pimeloyl-ACP methyl ester carboxylesterase